MTPTALLSWLRGVGAIVTVRDDQLVIDAPGGVVTDDLRRELRMHRDQLVALASEPDEHAVGWRVVAMREQLPPFPRPAPLLLARPELPYRPGACVSCGGVVKAPRCAACKAAVARVLASWKHEVGVNAADD